MWNKNVDFNKSLIYCLLISTVLWFIGLKFRVILRIIVFSLLILAIYFGLKKNNSIKYSLGILSYLAVLEQVIRQYAKPIPYLTIEYFFIIFAVIIFSKSTIRKLESNYILILFFLYTILEFIGLFHTVSINHGRSIFIMTLCMFLNIRLSQKVDINLSSRDFGYITIGFLCAGVNLALSFGYYLYELGGLQSIIIKTESNFDLTGGISPVMVTTKLSIVILFIIINFLLLNNRNFLMIFLGILLSFIMLFSFSRTGTVLTIICLLTLLITNFSKRSIGILVVSSIFGILIFHISTTIFDDFLIRRYFDSTSKADGRLFYMNYGIKLFNENFFSGVGTGNFNTEVKRMTFSIGGTHNEILRAFVEHGIIGGTLWLIFAFYIIAYPFIMYRGRVKSVGVILSFFVILSTFSNALKLFIQPFLIFIMLGLKNEEK